MPASSGKSGHGAVFGIDNGAGGWTTIAEVVSVQRPGLSRGAIDVSHLGSDDGYGEFAPAGLIRASEAVVELNFVEGGSDALQTAMEVNTRQSFRITFPNGTNTLTFDGIITGLEWNPMSSDDKMTATLTIQASGKPVLA